MHLQIRLEAVKRPFNVIQLDTHRVAKGESRVKRFQVVRTERRIVVVVTR